ncbi:MAG: TonB-dependent receptor, partial [Candidatus Eremiobacteraeota bacterium]|nr:TonB-dependent receptor [Candidatus Eremiobacteraeota bacterium]
MIQRFLSALLAVAFLFTGVTAGQAGTTGGIQGRVLDKATGLPLADVTVTASSPSQSAVSTTDAAGGYRFLSLAPDEYTVNFQKTGYDPVSQAGFGVFADQTETLVISLVKQKLTEIGRVTSKSTADLIKPGTTSDVYSVNTAGQEAAGALGGPGGLNNAYSAIASVPGAIVAQGQQGWYQGVSIRGGDIDQVGYELDGIPVNRAYDNAPQTMLTGLGQQELQVYTGGTPAGADAQGIAGYINQVIKTGTFPGFGRVNATLAAPTFYHRLSAEAGGASPDRHFSYYVGLAGVNQDYRYIDQQNGASNPGSFFYPLVVTNANPANNSFQYDGSVPAIFAPGQSYGIANTASRDVVANVHIALPHKNDNGRDDVQLLYLTSQILAGYYSSLTDLGATAPAALTALNGGAPIGYSDTRVYTGPQMQAFDPTKFQTYFFPSGPQNHIPGTPGFNTGGILPLNARDTNDNGVAIFKAQYQRNFNSKSYARLYGYTLYSNWFIDGPLSAFLNFGAEVADYEIPNHTFGLNLSYANQLNDKNLLSASVSYTQSNLQRYSTTGGFPGSGNIALTNFADSAGLCYNPTAGVQASCFSKGLAQGTVGTPTPGGPLVPGSPAALAGAKWIATETGYHANLNQVHPRFSAFSIADLYRPNDRLTLNLGVRVENFKFLLGDTGSTNSARQFFFNAYNRENCFAPGGPPTNPGYDATGALNPCPAGMTRLAGSPNALVNANAASQSDTVVQPRLGFTYQASPNTVYRGSFGVYARPENSSWVQYNTTQNDLASFLGSNFLQYGFNTPQHPIRPDVSYNYDLSLERQVAGTDLSFKITPFYRSTR